MAEVKWIKITTDMFDNRKIKHLRRLPDGNNIVLIWIMLLTMAGRCNSGGMIFLTENIPYTPKMLADELGFEENTVKLALEALERFGMIISAEEYFSIAGWQEYQNIEGMEKIREQTRKRVAKHREQQKLQVCNVTVTQRNATDIDKERDIEKDKENIIESPKKKTSRKAQAFVPPTFEEVEAYVKSRGNKIDAKDFFDYFNDGDWIDSNGKEVRNWKQKVITWESNRKGKDKPKTYGRTAEEKNAGYCFNQNEDSLDDLF